MRDEKKFINEITSYIFVENNPEKCDIIFVPGGLWPEPMERAAKLYNCGYAPYILPSGRFSLKFNHFTKPESKAQIYNKNYETEFESKCVTDALGLKIKKAIICCKSFHSKRCLLFYSWAYPDTEFLVCPVDIDGISKDNWFDSQHGIDIVMGELSRCGGQMKRAFYK